MLVHVYVQYHTHHGQAVVLRLYDAKDAGAITHQVDLQYYNEQFWQGSIDLDALAIKTKLVYSGHLIDNNYGTEHVIFPQKTFELKYKKEEISIFDQNIQPGSLSALSQTKASQVLHAREAHFNHKQKSCKNPTHLFRVSAPVMQGRYAVCLTGKGKELGNWSETDPVILEHKKNHWTAKLNLSKTIFPSEFKLAIYDHALKKIVQYEEGNNRILYGAGHSNSLLVFYLDASFTKYGWRGMGLNIPVSSLRSEKSWGIGDFTDLHLLTDLARETGIRMLQLLPVNDTTASKTKKDSYPYSANSPFALHPLYLNVEKLAAYVGFQFSAELKKTVALLNAKPVLDYEGVLKLKTSAIKLIYEQEKNTFKDDFAWIEFFDMNRHWLVPYAVFCYLRDKNDSADFSKWKEFSIYDEEAVEAYADIDNAQYDDICLHYFIQFHLHLQLKDAVDYAHKNGIIFKGDLPIGVGRHSVDCWMYPHLFHIDMQAGAPPDYYSATGQNWSFPTYNWEAMAADGYKWWRQRMEHLGNYFDAIRIDHVLGFFRIWSIPVENNVGTLGIFQPAVPIAATVFNDNGLHVSHERFCKPYITDEIIRNSFGTDAAWASNIFFEKGSFKDQYGTQAAIAVFFAANPQKKYLEEKLQMLLTNVLLIEDRMQPGYYHFRISMHATESFKALPAFERSVMDRLYNQYFFTDQNALWQAEGIKKLNALKSTTDMLLCAEDLGMVPEFMDKVLDELGILSLKVQRMPKEAGDLFSNPATAPYMSVVTTATHDMSTMREWWETERDHIQYFFNQVLGHYGTAPFYCEPWVARDIISQHLQSPAMWAVFLLQDLLAIDGNLRFEDTKAERINNPADPNHYWNYRMHLTLEQLVENKEFAGLVKELVLHSGR